MVNRYWGHNGVEERMFTPDKSLPEGWVEGRIKVPFLGTVKTKGKLWYNNGIEEKMFNPEEIPDEKWMRGRIKK